MKPQGNSTGIPFLLLPLKKWLVRLPQKMVGHGPIFEGRGDSRYLICVSEHF